MIKKITALVVAFAAVFFVAVPVYAQTSTSAGGTCGTTKTQLISCSSTTGTGTIGSLISIAVSVMTILIGIVAVGSLAYAGIIYASARDSQERVSQARGIIRNVILGLLLYGFTIAIINWLIPGSVISGGGTPATSPSPSAGPSSSVTPTPTPTPTP